MSDQDEQMSRRGWPGTQPRWIEGVAPRRRESQHSPMARTVCLSPGVQEPPAGARPALFRAPSCGGEGRFYVAGAAALLAGCSCVLSGGRASSHLVPSPPAEGKQGGWPPLNAEISACKKKMRAWDVRLPTALQALVSGPSLAVLHLSTYLPPSAPRGSGNSFGA